MPARDWRLYHRNKLVFASEKGKLKNEKQPDDQILDKFTIRLIVLIFSCLRKLKNWIINLESP
jgi:hypothetical protein